MSDEWRYFSDVDSAEIQQWMHGWRLKHPAAGALLLVAEQEKDCVLDLQRWARNAQLPIVGGVFPELIVQDAFQKEGVLICGLDPMPPYRLLASLSLEQGRDLAVESIQQMVNDELDDGTLMLIFDGMFGQVASMLDDLFYDLGGSCRYAGVNAGSETFRPMPCLFDHERCEGDSVLALALSNHEGAKLEHGYVVPEETLPASAAAGNRIVQIDWQPAFEKYSALIEKHYGQGVTRENFYSMGVHFPFALIRAGGQVLIRIPVAVDDEGALFCVGEVPSGALLSVAKAVEPGSAETVQTLLEKVRSSTTAGRLFFYCAGRRMHLGDAASAELARFAEGLPDQSVVGALSLGEIGNAPAGGYPLFHNAALVAMPFVGER